MDQNDIRPSRSCRSTFNVVAKSKKRIRVNVTVAFVQKNLLKLPKIERAQCFS